MSVLLQHWKKSTTNSFIHRGKKTAILSQPRLESDDNIRFGRKGKASPELAEAMGCSVSEREIYFTRRDKIVELAREHFDLDTKGWKERPEGAKNDMLAALAMHFPDVYGEVVSVLDRERRFGVLCKFIQRYKYANLKPVARSVSGRGCGRGQGPRQGRGRPRLSRFLPIPESVSSDHQKPAEDNTAGNTLEGNKSPSVEPTLLSSIKSPEDISQFLQGCSPPLTYLLEPLLAAGCVNKEYLSAMASWKVSEILDFLKAHVTLGSGQPISSLDACILVRQLKKMASSSVYNNA